MRALCALGLLEGVLAGAVPARRHTPAGIVRGKLTCNELLASVRDENPSALACQVRSDTAAGSCCEVGAKDSKAIAAQTRVTPHPFHTWAKSPGQQISASKNFQQHENSHLQCLLSSRPPTEGWLKTAQQQHAPGRPGGHTPGQMITEQKDKYQFCTQAHACHPAKQLWSGCTIAMRS
jgi:hypothetical protein